VSGSERAQSGGLYHGGPRWLCRLSYWSVAGIIGKPEALPSVKEYVTQEANIDTLLAENSPIQATCRAFRIPAGEAQGFTLLSS